MKNTTVKLTDSMIKVMKRGTRLARAWSKLDEQLHFLTVHASSLRRRPQIQSNVIMILCHKRKQFMCVSLRKLVNSPRCSDPSSSGLSTYNQTDNRKETISEVHHVFRIKLRDRRSLMQHGPLRSSWVRITFFAYCFDCLHCSKRRKIEI